MQNAYAAMIHLLKGALDVGGCRMKFAGLLVVTALAAAVVTPSSAQEKRTTSEQDVITQGTIPAPEGDIILSFGQTAQIYFKRPFKSIRLGDPLTVAAVPQNDHIVAFTALSPGISSVTLESADGRSTTTGNVRVMRSIHEVRIITPAPTDKTGELMGRSNVTIDMRQIEANAKASAEADYRALLCNDVGCQPVPAAGK
jgi:hypothetical protein